MSTIATETMNQEDTIEDEDETNEISSSDEDHARQSGKKRSSPDSGDDDGKKAERRAANRRSAFQSRQRRKILIEDLQRTVAALSKDNGDLRKSNDDLKVQLEAVLLENRQFRLQQQLSSQPGGIGLLGTPSLQSAQAFLRGGSPMALSQLLQTRGAAGIGGSIGHSATSSAASSGKSSSNESGDPLINARLALAMAQARGVGDNLNQSQHSAEGSQSSGENNAKSSSAGSSAFQPKDGIQGILSAASLSNAPTMAGLLQATGGDNAYHQLASLQGLLDARAGGMAGFGGTPLMGLLEQMRGGAPAGVSDIQRALGAQQGCAGNARGDTQNNVSDALRALLQKNR